MQTLESALANLQATIQQQQTNGQPLQPNATRTSDLPTSPTYSASSPNTGPAATQQEVALSPTGNKPGPVGLHAMPQTADQAVALLNQLTGAMLPYSVQSWLQDMETWQATQASTGQAKPTAVILSPNELATLRTILQSLTDLLAPAHTKGTELEQQILKLFAALNLYGGDTAKLKAQAYVWCEELEKMPLFAIRKAYRWAIRGGHKMPTLAAFIADCRLAVGTDVLNRRKLLIELVGDYKNAQ